MQRHDAMIASAESDDYIAMLFFSDVDEFAGVGLDVEYRVDLKAKTSAGKDRSQKFQAKNDIDAKRKFYRVCKVMMEVKLEAPVETAPPKIQEPSAPYDGVANYGRF
jgi:hypothetical protein